MPAIATEHYNNRNPNAKAPQKHPSHQKPKVAEEPGPSNAEHGCPERRNDQIENQKELELKLKIHAEYLSHLSMTPEDYEAK